MSKGMLTAVIVVMAASAAFAEIGEPILIGKGHDPQWSPDETHIAFLQGDNLMVKRLDSPEEARHLYTGPILRYYWLDDSTLAAQERKMDMNRPQPFRVSKIVRVSLTGDSEVLAYDSLDASRANDADLRLTRFAHGAIGFHEGIVPPGRIEVLVDSRNADTANSETSLFLGTEPIGAGKVWLYYGSKERGRQVTRSENYYDMLRLAPSLDKFFCKSQRGDLVVFDTLGNELANLGVVDMYSWDHRGEYILYCKTEYSHYDLEASDLWIAKYDGSEVRQLTDTPDVIETGGVFSPSSMYLAYTNGRTGELYIVNLDSVAATAK